MTITGGKGYGRPLYGPPERNPVPLFFALALVFFLALPGDAHAQTASTVDEPFLTLLWRYRWHYLRATLKTIQISVLAMVLASTLGLTLALCRLYGNRFVARAALAYIEFVRGTPLLVQLYIIFFGLPNIPVIGEYLRLPQMTAAVLGIGLNYAAYEAEIYRSGMMAVPRSQTEAGLALGLTRPHVIRLIVLPQAFRLVTPPVTNDFVALFKDTSIVSILGLTELTQTFRMSSTSTQRFLGFALVTAFIYFVLSYPISKFARYLERRIHPHHDLGPQPQ